MRASSPTFFASLEPDAWLRLVVLCTGRVLYAATLVLLLLLEVPAAVRLLLAVLLLAAAHRRLAGLQRGFRHCHGIRFHGDGRVEVRDPASHWQNASLLDGSLVLGRMAWLCIRTADGVRIVELLRGDPRQSHDWRRLQLIWRHVGARP